GDLRRRRGHVYELSGWKELSQSDRPACRWSWWGRVIFYHSDVGSLHASVVAAAIARTRRLKCPAKGAAAPCARAGLSSSTPDDHRPRTLCPLLEDVGHWRHRPVFAPLFLKKAAQSLWLVSGVPMWMAPRVGGRDHPASDVASKIAFNRLRR